MDIEDFCMICNRPEKSKHYEPKSHIDFVCSNCVIIISGMDAADIKEEYRKALMKENHKRVEGLKMFLGKIPKTKRLKK